jgi:lipoate-protein ligase A
MLRPELETDPAAWIAADEALLQGVINQACGPLVCISRAPQCLVVTRREARMSGFARAAQNLAARGWPLVVRSSGGSAVPQGPGILNLALIYPRPQHWRLEDGFLLLCQLLGDFLWTYGLQAETGEVPGSFCDGRYNLQVDGRKLVGTAQRWAGTARHPAVLCHACLLVDPELDAATAQLNYFYQQCQSRLQFIPDSSTSLRQCLNVSAAVGLSQLMDEVESRLCTQLVQAFNIK